MNHSITITPIKFNMTVGRIVTGTKGDKGDTGPTGPQGPTGEGFVILGYYADLAALEAAVLAPSAGDAYGVGASARMTFMFMTVGSMGKQRCAQGPQGGATGPQARKGPRGNGQLGPQGRNRELRATRVKRARKGPARATTLPFRLLADLTTLNAAVPLPSVGDAYGIGSAAPYDIYVWDGSWVTTAIGALTLHFPDRRNNAQMMITYRFKTHPKPHQENHCGAI